MPLWVISLIIVIGAATVTVIWKIYRKLMLTRLERHVLAEKYGDVDMFSARLKEWKVKRHSKK